MFSDDPHGRSIALDVENELQTETSQRTLKARTLNPFSKSRIAWQDVHGCNLTWEAAAGVS